MRSKTRSPADVPGDAAPPAVAPRATYRSVFAIGEFGVLFAGMLMYVLGFEFEILGLSVLIYAQTRSALLAALAFGTGFAPQAIGGALFTSIADRLRPQTVITAGLVIRAAPGVLIGSLPQLPVAIMLALVAVTAMAAPVFSAAISGVLPDVLEGDRYILGRSVFGLTAAAAQLFGLGAGGAILALLPARALLLAAGCALLLSALTGLGLRPRPARAPGGRAGAAPRSGTVRATLAGNARLLADPVVRGLLLVQWLPAWFITAAESLIIPYTHTLGHPASSASPLLAAAPAGMLIGDLAIGRLVRPATRERLAFPLALLLGLPLLTLAARPPLLAAAAALFAAGLGFGYQLCIQQAFLDSVPPPLRGQVFGLNSTGLMGGQGLLPPAAGAAALALGVGPAMALAGAATTLAALALRGPLTTHTRPRHPPLTRTTRPGARAPGGRRCQPESAQGTRHTREYDESPGRNEPRRTTSNWERAGSGPVRRGGNAPGG